MCGRVRVRRVYEDNIIAVVEESECVAHSAAVDMGSLPRSCLLQIGSDNVTAASSAVNEVNPFCSAAQSFNAQSTAAGI
jgi:hypothetical protein